MATVALVVRAGRADHKGYAPVRLRVSHRGTRRFLSLGIKVLASKWDGGREQVRRSHPNRQEINARLSQVKGEAQAAITHLATKNHVLTADLIRGEIEQRLSGEKQAEIDFIGFAQRYVDDFKRREKIGSYKAYRAVLEKFKEFWGRERCPFSAITVELMREFRTFCYEVRENNANTVGKALRYMRTFYRQAQIQGYISREEYIWDEIDIDSEPVQKEMLSDAEMAKIEALWEEGAYERGTVSHVMLAAFLAQYYGGGMRFGDVATLRWEHVQDGRLRYKMRKNAKGPGIPIGEKLRGVLDAFREREGRYERVFPLLDAYEIESEADLHDAIVRQNALANKYLKKIAARAEVKTSVSTHLARNMAAWKLYQRTGDIYKVMKMLEHSSVEQTRKYLKGFYDESLDEDIKALF